MSADLNARRRAAAAELAGFNHELHSAPLSKPPGREWMFRLSQALEDLLDALGTAEAPGHEPAGTADPAPGATARPDGRAVSDTQPEDLAAVGGVDLDYVYANEPGAGPLFRAARGAVEDLDGWAINNAAANRAGRETYDHTERWCHRPGGILPAARGQDVTPARMRALAGQAEALAAAIAAAHGGFRARDSEDPVRRAGFRLSDAAGQARAVAAGLHETAADLARIAARPPGSCVIPWGVCPEHGNTLTSTGGKTWCTTPRCGRAWGHDRLAMSCAEPARWKLTDQHGAEALLCDGHALDARNRLEGAMVVPLDPPPGRWVPDD